MKKFSELTWQDWAYFLFFLFLLFAMFTVVDFDHRSPGPFPTNPVQGSPHP